MRRLRLAFDIGGTFTDLVLEEPAELQGQAGTGEARGSRVRAHRWKTLTRAGDPTAGVLDGISHLLERAGASFEDLTEIVHATTVAANAVLERRGPRTGLITTSGFRDVLLIGRQKRYELYDLGQRKPTPLIPRRMVHGVRERMDAEGKVVTAVDGVDVDDALDRLQTAAGGLESLAICLLHAYANPDHEVRIRDRVLELAPELAVSLSSEVCPRRGEYERTSTTVADAYVKPVVERYLAHLLSALRRRGFAGRLFVMQSNGGLTTPELALRQPIKIVESGPAAGVLMAARCAGQAGHADALAFDMGGTTAKVGLIKGNRPMVRDTFEIDAVNYRRGSGLPLAIPAIDLLEIGAGGGSLASARAGTIQIGPESAGSEPGPVCYGRGGTDCTVTDANVVLGYLDPEYFAGGSMILDGEAAAAAIAEQIARPLGISVLEAAWGIHVMANASMERALRVISVERGHDPREHCLVAIGGAGPAHAARLAMALSMPQVVIPRGAGVGSAIGLLAAPMRFDLNLTRQVPIDGGIPEVLRAQLAELRERCAARYGLTGEAGIAWECRVDMRYRGQGHQIPISLPPDQSQTTSADQVMRLFEKEYRRLYGYLQDGADAEIVEWTVTATRARTEPDPAVRQVSRRPVGDRAEPSRPSRRGPLPGGTREAFFPERGGRTKTRVWRMDALDQGDHVEGPAVVESTECTVVIPPRLQARMDDLGNLLVQTGGPR